jgi:hypothetical protein
MICHASDEECRYRGVALNLQRIVDEKPATKKQPRGSRAKADEKSYEPTDKLALLTHPGY